MSPYVPGSHLPLSNCECLAALHPVQAGGTLFSRKACFKEVIMLLYKAGRNQIKSRLMLRSDIKHEASQ